MSAITTNMTSVVNPNTSVLRLAKVAIFWTSSNWGANAVRKMACKFWS